MQSLPFHQMSKNLKVAKEVEQLGLEFTASGNINSNNHLGNFSGKIEQPHICEHPRILLGVYPREYVINMQLRDPLESSKPFQEGLGQNYFHDNIKMLFAILSYSLTNVQLILILKHI